jgi:hypothetical protein
MLSTRSAETCRTVASASVTRRVRIAAHCQNLTQRKFSKVNFRTVDEVPYGAWAAPDPPRATAGEQGGAG